MQSQEGIWYRGSELRIGRWSMDIGRLPTVSRNEVIGPLTFEPILVEPIRRRQRLES